MFKKFLPQIYAESIYDINLSELEERGVRAFVLDIDNTLAPYAAPEGDERLRGWIALLRERGFKLYIASNNDGERVERFCVSIDVPYIAKAGKPLSRGFMKACEIMGVAPEETGVIGDQLFTDIYGGNRLNMPTVLVKPISDAEGKFIKFKRFFERIILKNRWGC